MWFHNIGWSPKTDFTVVPILAINNIFEHENVKKKNQNQNTTWLYRNFLF
jgi:hypothetical protein